MRTQTSPRDACRDEPGRAGRQHEGEANPFDSCKRGTNERGRPRALAGCPECGLADKSEEEHDASNRDGRGEVNGAEPDDRVSQTRASSADAVTAASG